MLTQAFARCRSRQRLAGLGLLLFFTMTGMAVEPSSTGSLTIRTIPPHAEVRIDGKFYGRAPITAEGLSVGGHEVVVKLSGFAAYRTVVNVDSGRTAAVEVTLSSAIYEQWREQYYRAIVSNVLLPGKGQVDNGHQRGWGYFMGYLASAGYAYYCSNRYHHYQENYNGHLSLYRNETDPATTLTRYRDVLGDRDKMGYYQGQFRSAMTVMGAVWAVSLVDAFFFTVPKPLINDANPVRISARPGPGGVMIGLTVTASALTPQRQKVEHQTTLRS